MGSEPQRKSYIRALILWRDGGKETRGPKPVIGDYLSHEKMVKMKATMDKFFSEGVDNVK